MNIPDAFSNAAFWVALTFAGVIIWLIAHAYWMQWATKQLKDMERRLKSLEDANARMKEDIKEINSHNPYLWMKRAN